MAMYSRGGNTLVREMNLSTVLGYLYSNAPLSRAKLAHQTGLNKSTISSLIEELIELGLVYETGQDASSLRRPATLLELNPRAGYIIGVEIGVGFITILVTNFVGRVIWRRSKEVDYTTPQEKIISLTSQLVSEAREEVSKGGVRLLGMGVALPGMVDVERGTLVFSPNLQWRDVPLQQIFSAQTGLPVFVDNDATAAALGEHLFGVARRKKHFVFIIAGVGVGGGLFLDGKIYRGASGLAGEIGHTSMFVEQARPCRCGYRGCWENSANQSALIERVRSRLEVGRQSLIKELIKGKYANLTLAMITEAAEAGDAEVLEALSETGNALGVGVANMINIFNPEMVVIGGALSVAGKFLLPSIQKAINERALSVISKQAEVRLSAFGPDASVMGGVAMVVERILSNPTTIDSGLKMSIKREEVIREERYS